MKLQIHRRKARRFRCRISTGRQPVKESCLGICLLKWLACLLLLSGVQEAGAQLAPPEDFFNSGAQLYISNNIPAALEQVENGLKTYPDDEKLKKLEQLLKQQQQQNQQQQNQQNQSQQQKQEQQKKQQNQQQNQSSQSQSQAQQKQDEQQQQAEQKKAEQQKQQAQQQAAQKKEAEEKKQPDEAQPAKPGQMTPEEAKRLLDAQKGDEQLLQWKPPEKQRSASHPIRDW